MGKRSNFERKPRDFYPTPESAVLLLLHAIYYNTFFAEPCAGNGALIKGLEKHGHVCKFSCDIEPQSEGILRKDALSLSKKDVRGCDIIITNPPWDRKILHPMIEHFLSLKPTALLIDADWMHTKQAAPYLEYCTEIISIGRVKWISDSNMTGKDNCCWYIFDKSFTGQTTFIARECGK